MEKSNQTTPLLYSRKEAARLLGNVSIATIIRLEQQGRLKPIRLSRSPSAQIFFKASDLIALVEEAANAK